MSVALDVPIHKIESGPVLVLAGPGTGKTHSMALRVKWLIQEKGVNPDAITVMTFTTDAAFNMRHRLSDEEKEDVFVPSGQQPTRISTMHSIGHQIISTHLQEFGVDSEFRVLADDRLRRLLFEDAAQMAGLKRYQGRDAHTQKSCGVRIDEGHQFWQNTNYYNSILRACDHIDFDDQILLATELLDKNPALLAEYQTRAVHLLIDEYQDINNAQFEFIKRLSGKNTAGLFVVGDDDQSIYSFRGGSPEFIRNFKQHFGENTKVLGISCCRRCPPNVLYSALSVVSKFNPKRLTKLKSSFKNDINTPIQFVSSPTAEREAIYIAKKCSCVTPSHDVLILVPHLNFAKPILNALRHGRVAYDCRSIFSAEGFSSLDVLGRWLLHSNDNLALRQTIQYLIETDKFGVPSIRSRKPEKIAKREQFLSEVSSLWKHVLENNITLFDALKQNAQKSKFLANILKSLQELLSAYPNTAEEFLDSLREHFLPWGMPSEMFQEISAWIDEVKGHGGAGRGTVRIMSMRLAKGLEADYVFIVGLEQDVFPRKGANKDETEEACRLLFVSMTRAKMELNLCCARTRSAANTYLPGSFALVPTSFLSAIPKNLYRSVFLPASSKARKKD